MHNQLSDEDLWRQPSKIDVIRDGLARTSQASFVTNAGYQAGMLSSLQCGLRALPPDVDAVLFTPVDYPAMERETIARLIAAMHSDPAANVVRPRVEGRNGHPVLFLPGLLKLRRLIDGGRHLR